MELQPLQFHDGNTVFERNGGQFHCGGVTTEGGVSKSLGETSACRTTKGVPEASLNMVLTKQVHPERWDCANGDGSVTPALDVVRSVGDSALEQVLLVVSGCTRQDLEFCLTQLTPFAYPWHQQLFGISSSETVSIRCKISTEMVEAS